MVFVKHRKGAQSKSCRLCRSRPRANGYTVCRKAGPCRVAYNIERDEKLRTMEAASAGVLTRGQRRALQRQLEVDSIPSTPIDGMAAQYKVKVPEELFPKKYPVLDHSDLSVRQFDVDIGDENGRACREHIVERVKKRRVLNPQLQTLDTLFAALESPFAVVVGGPRRVLFIATQ